MFIDGARITDGAELDVVVNPATQDVLGQVLRPTLADVERAVQVARTAQESWERVSPRTRQDLMLRWASAISEAEDEVAAVLTDEHGKPLGEALLEVQRFVRSLEHGARLVGEVGGRTIDPLPDGAFGFTVLRPLGVVGVATGWRFPLAILARKLAPALATGNAIIALVPPSVSLSMTLTAELLTEAGLPSGLLNVLGGEPGLELTAQHPGVARLTYAPEYAAAYAYNRAGWGPSSGATSDAPGLDASIVCADADIDAAVSAACWAAFFNGGQSPMALRRMFVDERIVEEVVDRCIAKTGRLEVGDPTDGAHIGPLHRADVYANAAAYRDRLVAAGAQVVTGGGDPAKRTPTGGWYLDPAIALMEEEALAAERAIPEGPTLVIHAFSEAAAAMRAGAAAPFAVGTSIWTADIARAQAAMREARSGYLWVNSPTRVHDQLPLHLEGRGGRMVDHGPEALLEHQRVLTVAVGR